MAIDLSDFCIDSDNEEADFSTSRIESRSLCECGGTFLICNIDGTEVSRCVNCDSIEESNGMETNVKSTGLTIDQTKNVFKELQIFNKNCVGAGIRPFDDRTISIAVDIFSLIRGYRGETRNKNRKQHLGASIYIACQIQNNMRSRKEIQLFCTLADRNITTALTELQTAINTKTIMLSYPLPDPRKAFTRGVCLRVEKDNKTNMTDEDVGKLYDDVLYILEVISSNILICSNFDSKTLGAIYITLRLHGYAYIQLQHLCTLAFVHLETVQTITECVKNNEHLFTVFNERYKRMKE